jgi:hypothetical protein
MQVHILSAEDTMDSDSAPDASAETLFQAGGHD